MALEGSLKEFNLADILQLLYFQKKTGVLTLQGRTDRVRLQFHEGNIVGAESWKRDAGNRLGRMLIGQGVISQEQLDQAMKKQQETRQKLGSILVREGTATVQKIQEVLSFQITETLVQLFSWQEGRYDFKAQMIPVDKDVPIVINTEHFLMEGLRFVDEWSQIKDRIGVDSVFVPVEGYGGELTNEDARVLDLVDGVRDVGVISDATGIDSFQVSRTLLALLDRGAIAVPGAEEEGRELVRQARPIPALKYLIGFLILFALAASCAALYLFTDTRFREFQASEKLDSLRIGIEALYHEKGSYPESVPGKDPWGNPYVYDPGAEGYLLLSAGPDGMQGTDDDLR